MTPDDAPVTEVEPATVEVSVTRDRARLVEEDGEWETLHDYEAVATCDASALERRGAP